MHIGLCTQRMVLRFSKVTCKLLTTFSLAKSDELSVVVVIVIVVIVVVLVVRGGGGTVVSEFSECFFPHFLIHSSVVCTYFVSYLGALGLNLDLCFCLLSPSRQFTAMFPKLLYIQTLFGFEK
jgi:hypothetical protein